MSGGGSGGGGAQVIEQKPTAAVQGIMNLARPRIEGLYNRGEPALWTGDTRVPLTYYQNQALQGITGTAMGGGPDVLRAGLGNAAATLGGDFLYGGPGFDAAVDAATRYVEPRVNSAFNAAGRSGSGLAEVAKAREISDAFASQYGAERGRQAQALALMPQLEQAAYSPYQRLAQAGDVYQQQSQNRLNDRIRRFEATANRPFDRLDRYLNYGQQLAAMAPGAGQRVSPLTEPSALQGALGGAATGAGIASALGPSGAGLALGPWGWALPALGAAAGLLA